MECPNHLITQIQEDINKLVRVECVYQHYVVAIVLGIIFLLLSLSLPRSFLFYQKEGS